MKTKLLIISLIVSMYNHAQTVSKPDRIVVSIWKNSGYNDIVLNTWPSSTEELNININSSISDKGFISIYNMNGELIKQEGITIQNGENNYIVDINNIISDIYTVKISGTLFNTSKKIAL
ncbi:MAG TPA: T9SS type A sorting domain-containing protein [Bacteroidia bacterium]|nr:T9SS type A sorting domain-containing protein [Bacteroidia bacterium]